MQILLTGTSNSGGSLFLWTSCCGCTLLGINHISMIHFLKPSVLHWYCTQASLIRLESAKKNYWSFGTNSLRTYILYRWTSTNSTLMTRRCKKKERMELAVLPQVWNRFSKTLPQIYKYGACRIGLGLNRFSKTNAQFWQCCITSCWKRFSKNIHAPNILQICCKYVKLPPISNLQNIKKYNVLQQMSTMLNGCFCTRFQSRLSSWVW